MEEVSLEKSNFQVIGMRRSGHHAIIAWLSPNLGCDINFFNNCAISRDYKVFCYKRHRPGTTLLNFEDKSLTVVAKVKPGRRILVLRDPFNCIASRIKMRINKKHKVDHRHLEKDVSLWKQYAYEFIRKTNYLGDCVRVNYNKWFVDQKYRVKIANKFAGLKEDSKNHVWFFSSFDKKDYHGKAEEMNVLGRWKQIKHPIFKKVLEDESLHKLSNRIFGNILD